MKNFQNQIRFVIIFVLAALIPLTGAVFAETQRKKAESPVVAPPKVAEIQRDLEQIMRIHQTLQLQRQAQIQEIQRITEQARLHQQLLKDLTPPRPPSPTPAGVDIEEIIRLQKIRLIQEQAFKNRSRLEEIKKGGGKATAGASESATGPAAPPISPVVAPPVAAPTSKTTPTEPQPSKLSPKKETKKQSWWPFNQ